MPRPALSAFCALSLPLRVGSAGDGQLEHPSKCHQHCPLCPQGSSIQEVAQPDPDTQRRLQAELLQGSPAPAGPRLLLYCSSSTGTNLCYKVLFNGEGSSPGFRRMGEGKEKENKQGTHNKITIISSLLLFFLPNSLIYGSNDPKEVGTNITPT